MSGPVRGLELRTAGTAVPNKGWDRSSFLIRLYGFVPLHPLLLWTLVYPSRVLGAHPRGIESYRPLSQLGVLPRDRGNLGGSPWLLRFVTGYAS